jgi:hypothetical protein
MVDTGSSAQRGIENRKLSRYASFLVFQNADPQTASGEVASNHFEQILEMVGIGSGAQRAILGPQSNMMKQFYRNKVAQPRFKVKILE